MYVRRLGSSRDDDDDHHDDDDDHANGIETKLRDIYAHLSQTGRCLMI